MRLPPENSSTSRADPSSSWSGAAQVRRNSRRSSGKPCARSEPDVEKDRLLVTLQDNIPLKSAGLPRGISCHQGSTPRGFDQIENEIVGVGRFIREINTRHQSPQQPAHEHRYNDMGSLLGSPGSGHRARFYRREAKSPVTIRGNSAKSFETGRDGLVLRVFGMSVFSMAVRLPDLEQGIGYGLAVPIQNTADDGQLLARKSWARAILIVELGQANREEGTDSLGRRGFETQFNPPWAYPSGH